MSEKSLHDRASERYWPFLYFEAEALFEFAERIVQEQGEGAILLQDSAPELPLSPENLRLGFSRREECEFPLREFAQARSVKLDESAFRPNLREEVRVVVVTGQEHPLVIAAILRVPRPPSMRQQAAVATNKPPDEAELPDHVSVNLKSWCSFVRSIAGRRAGTFLRDYAAIGPVIADQVTRFDGLKSAIESDFTLRSSVRLNTSLLLSDFTSVYPLPNIRGLQVELHFGGDGAPSQATVPDEFLEGLLFHEGGPAVAYAYAMPAQERVQRFLDSLEPFVESGRLMVRPLALIGGVTTADDGKIGFKFNQAHTDLPGGSWVSAIGLIRQESLPIVTSPMSGPPSVELCKLTMPYLGGISPAELNRILDDEQDCLAAFRTSVRELVRQAEKEPDRATEVISDVVLPAVDKVERHFNVLRRSRPLLRGGLIVGSVVASLGAFWAPSAATVLLPIAGAALGTAVRDAVQRREAIRNLRDLPFYLLWRLRKQRQRR